MSIHPNSTSIADLAKPGNLLVPLEASDKRSAIDLLVDHVCEAEKVDDVEEMKHLVWAREDQRSTGIGNGLAIPHAKSDAISRLMLGIGILPGSVDFESIDERPVRMVALLLSPSSEIAEHIQARGKISRMMNDEGFREAAFACTDARELRELIVAACD